MATNPYLEETTEDDVLSQGGAGPERKTLIVVAAVVVLAVVGFFLWPQVEESLAPEPHQAWAAIEAEGSGVARVGWVRLPAGTPFTLHAVLEARTREGEAVYYTEAPALEIGGEAVPAESLRPWDRGRHPKVKWFTVEGAIRERPAQDATSLERFRLQEVYRPAWANTWAIPGSLDVARTENEERPFRQLEAAFGTQRYHVRVEIFKDEQALLPDESYKSWGADVVREKVESFPGVTASLDGTLGPASEVFGLSQLEPQSLDPDLVAGLRTLSRQRLAFSRLTVLFETAQKAGLDPSSDLPWQPLELSSRAAWGETVNPGDALQVLERLVLLYEDRGEEGVLDPQDLVFDFAQGAAVRTLEQVFGSEGEVRWAPLGSAGSSRPAS